MRVIATVLLGALTLAACSTDEERCDTSQNPAQCRQVVQAGGNADDYLLYGMAGYMLGSTMSGGQRQTVIVPDPNYRGYRPAVASYDQSRSFVQRRTVSTTIRNGVSTRTTRTTTRWSSPSPYRSTFRPTTFRAR